MASGTDASRHLDVRVVVHDADVEISEDELQHIQEDLRAVAAGRLYANRQVSIGKAAELCGLTVAELVEKLAEWHMPVIQYPLDQVRHDLADYRDTGRPQARETRGAPRGRATSP